MGLRLRQEGPSSLDWDGPAGREQGRDARFGAGSTPSLDSPPLPSASLCPPLSGRSGLAWAARVVAYFFLTFSP